MTTPDANEFIRQLDQDPELLEKVRTRILTRELLELPETVAQLAAAQQETNRQLDRLTGSVQRIEGTLGNLTGTAYKNRAGRLIPRLLARYLRLQQTQALQTPNSDTRPYLDDLVNHAVTSRTITDQQAQELERTDIVAMAKDSEDRTVFVIVEASITIGDSDIDRAHERALIMGRLTSSIVHAAVIGQDISPANRQRADGLGITFMPLSQ